MSTSSHDSATTATTDFGANEWLVDEMYERFQEDPASVDQAWRALFEERQRQSSSLNGADPASGTATAPAASAGNGVTSAPPTHPRHPQ